MIKIIQARTDTVLTVQYAHVNSVLTTSAYGGEGHYYHSHFTDEETEEQRG